MLASSACAKDRYKIDVVPPVVMFEAQIDRAKHQRAGEGIIGEIVPALAVNIARNLIEQDGRRQQPILRAIAKPRHRLSESPRDVRRNAARS